MSSKKSPTEQRSLRRFSRRRDSRFRFPRRPGNLLLFLNEADAWYDAACESIAAAHDYILFETYLASSGKLMRSISDSLCAAARRGVAVYLLVDDYGGRGLSMSARQRLRDGGVNLRFYNPLRHRHWMANLRRDHRKLLLVDGELAFVTGAGLTDDFSRRAQGEDFWRDTALRISGPAVADCFTLFVETWCENGGTLKLPAPAHIAHPGGASTRVLSARPGRNDIIRALIRHIRNARDSIWLATPYFVPTRKLYRAIRRAAQRGVEVRLMLPGDKNDHLWVSYAARNRYQRLLRSGVRIFEYQPAFMHTKLALIDDWATTGSSNFDRWDQRWNLDLNVAFDSCQCLAQIQEYFQENFSLCEEIVLADWHRRPWHRKLREKLARLLVSLLERIGRNRRRH